ncbi:MAG: hypothetical protein SGJ15_09410 [Bacteroidota bacterium]|nr:hypothetical protein [Bacteroidota bacterium]
MKFLFLIIFSLSSLTCISQDTLVLCKRNNETKLIKIPFEEFELKFITNHSKRYRALLTGSTDSTLIIRQRSKDPEKSIYISQEKRKYRKLLRSRDWREMQVDSINFIKNKSLKRINYPSELMVSFSDIKKIKLNNHHRVDKQKKLKAIENIYLTILVVSTIGGIIFITAVPVVFLAQMVFIYLGSPIIIAAQKSRLDMFDGWKIKQAIKN